MFQCCKIGPTKEHGVREREGKERNTYSGTGKKEELSWYLKLLVA